MILPRERDPRLVTVRRGGTLDDDDHRLLALWAAECAEHVLPLFEAALPDDRRPREAIEQVRAWARGEVRMMASRAAGGHAMGAARDQRGAPRFAAYAAGQAACVPHVAEHDLGAAAYAIKAVRASVAAADARAAGAGSAPGSGTGSHPPCATSCSRIKSAATRSAGTSSPLERRSVAAVRSIEVVADDGTALHVGVTGSGADVLVLSGGPGCVHYLERDDLVPPGVRAWHPEPRGVGRSGGGPHDLARAVADLECVRRAAGVTSWPVLGHSWGSDLALRYALDVPESVVRVVGVAGHGLHRDRTWSEVYEAGRDAETGPDVAWVEEVWAGLWASFTAWVHEPDLWRRLADTAVPVHLVAAGGDHRPDWPLRQLAALVPRGSFAVVPDVPHDFWHGHPDTWRRVAALAVRA